MGRGKAWCSLERERVVLSYIRASCDPIVGRNQRSETFSKKMHEEFVKVSPTAKYPGTFNERSVRSVYSCFKNSVSGDVAAFNKSLRMIHASKCTGCTEDDKINMAVAIHCKATTIRDYNMKTFRSEEKWPNFRAWKVLQVLEKYKFHANQFEDLDTTFSEGDEELPSSDVGHSVRIGRSRFGCSRFSRSRTCDDK